MEKSGACEDTAPKVSIKKEACNDDLKEFAETAMNELLGWYGYGSHRETRGCKSRAGSNSSGPESPKYNEGCGWCGKAVDETTALSSAAATFCSELCFSQSRRASFKKNKTCDWCRHVRHTVSYVDSQDGSSQLQFCSDKCLNQYKMHIFWRETRAHLEIHPHIHAEESSGTLITPDLWMNKCKSPEGQSSTPSSSPKLVDRQQTSPLPLITVAHPSKLMALSHQETPEPKRHQKNKVHKKNKRKLNSIPVCTSTVSKSFFPEMPQDLRVRQTPTDFERSEGTTANEIKADEVTCQKKLFDGLVPPPTILVPYPILLPIPIPIPIPIPLPIPNNFLNKKNKVEEGTQTVPEEKKKNTSLIIEIDNAEDMTDKIVTRPLRKRKRIVEKKTKFVIKNKKILST